MGFFFCVFARCLLVILLLMVFGFLHLDLIAFFDADTWI